MDLCHLDEAGFAPTLPTSFSWFLAGERLFVPYEAPQGRRVNAIGALFTHGPCAGEFLFDVCASLPKREREKKTTKPRRRRGPEPAARHGLREEEVGTIDSRRLLGFLWRVAGRPPEAPEGWRRERPLVVALDNYSVHKSQEVKATLAELRAADVHLIHLPAYSPELSRIEPVWQDVKYHQMPERSFDLLGRLKQEVEAALTREAEKLHIRYTETQNLLRQPT